jgi:hypothetical protein
MDGNEDMKVVFLVNYMALEHIAMEFLSISLAFGADD